MTTSPTQLLGALHRLTETAVAAPGRGAIYEAAVDAICDALEADRAAVLLLDSSGVMRFEAARGLSGEYMAAVEGHSPWAPGETSPKPVLVADVANSTDVGPLRDTILAEGIAAVAFVPLVYRGALLGKFMAYYRAPHLFTDDEVEFAQTVAAHVAFAVEQRRLEDDLRLANEQLSTTLHSVDDAIMVRRPDGTILFANDAAGRLLGFADGAALQSATPTELSSQYEVFDGAGGVVLPEQLPGRRALAGEHPPEILLRYRAREGGVPDRWSLVSASPVHDSRGRLRFAVSVFRDVTERERAAAALRKTEGHLELLASASPKLLAASLDDRQVLHAAADVLVPDLADSCTIWELQGGGLERAVTRARASGSFVGPPDDVVLDVIRAGRTRVLGPSGRATAMVVPLEARGHPVGGLVLGRLGGSFDAAEVALVEDVAWRAALAFDNARLFRERSRVAETLQNALLPPRLPDIPGVELAARYRPAASDVGGDFYDVVDVGPGRWMVVVGDVCGKGIEAASLTAVARATVRALATEHQLPSALLTAMNAVLLRQLAPDRFCTLTCVVVDVNGPTPRLTLSLAGQPRPLIVRSDGSVATAGHHGTVLGILPDVEVEDIDLVLGEGDALVLYTDGCLTDLPPGGEEALVETVAADGAIDVVDLAAAVEAAGPPEDDVTVLALRIAPAG